MWSKLYLCLFRGMTQNLKLFYNNENYLINSSVYKSLNLHKAHITSLENWYHVTV
jgi:hypothetical protein